jgi:hypothetical protein
MAFARESRLTPQRFERTFYEGFATGNAVATESVKAAIRDVHSAVPDISFTIEDAVESGDTIWVTVHASGNDAARYLTYFPALELIAP